MRARTDERSSYWARSLLAVAALAVAAACAPTQESEMPPPAATAATQAVPSPAAAPVAQARWAQAAPLPERRTEVSATTDGRYIYLTGGFTPPQGQGRATSPRTLWRFDPQANQWTALTQIPQGVHHAPFQYHNGKLYILGGFRETSFEPVANVRIYDLARGQWSEGAPMPTPRGATGWTVLNGRIHVLGGNAPGPDAVHDHTGAQITQDRSVNVHEAYDPARNTWTRLAPMPTPRNHLGAAALNGRIHAVLGRVGSNFTMTAHEVYDPATDSWSTGPAVPTGRSGVAVLEHAGHVYAFGGETFGEGGGKTFNEAERFDARAGRWERLPPMPTARHGLGAAAIGNSIHVISGGPSPGFAFGDFNERLDVGQ